MRKQLIEVQDLDVSVRLRGLLVMAAIRYIQELSKYSKEELINDYGFGLKSMKELKIILKRYDINLQDRAKIKTYKLIQIYPGSPIKGTLAKTYEDSEFYFHNEPISNIKYLIQKAHIENYPKHWHKIN